MTGDVHQKNDIGRITDFIKTVGFPIFVAIILLGMLTGIIPFPLVQIEVKIDKAMERQMKHSETTDGQNAMLIRLMRATCRHTAKTELQAKDCD